MFRTLRYSGRLYLNKRICQQNRTGKIFQKNKKKLLLRYKIVSIMILKKKNIYIIAEEFIDGFVKYSFTLMQKLSIPVSHPSAKSYVYKVSINILKNWMILSKIRITFWNIICHFIKTYLYDQLPKFKIIQQRMMTMRHNAIKT